METDEAAVAQNPTASASDAFDGGDVTAASSSSGSKKRHFYIPGEESSAAVTTARKAFKIGNIEHEFAVTVPAFDIIREACIENLNALGTEKDKKYSGYGDMAKDAEKEMSLGVMLKRAMQHDCAVAVVIFPLLFSCVISMTLQKELDRRVIDPNAYSFWALGHPPTAAQFRAKEYETDHDDEDLVQRLKELLGVTHFILQLILNARRQGQIVLEHTWAMAVVAKNSGLSRGGIVAFNSFWLIPSPRVIDKNISHLALQEWYTRKQLGLVSDVQRTIPDTNESIYVANVKTDNNNPKIWAKEPNLGSTFMACIISCTIMVYLIKKAPYYNNNPDRPPALTPYDLNARRAATDLILSGKFLLSADLYEDGPLRRVPRRQKEHKQHLRDFTQVASDDRSSSSHRHHAAFCQQFMLYLTGGTVRLEIFGDWDTEFILETRKMAFLHYFMYRDIALCFCPFHGGMHGTEVWKDDPIVIALLYLVVCRYLDHKKNAYGPGGTVEKALQSLVEKSKSVSFAVVRPPGRLLQDDSTVEVGDDDDEDDDDDLDATHSSKIDDPDVLNRSHEAARWSTDPVEQARVLNNEWDEFAEEISVARSDLPSAVLPSAPSAVSSESSSSSSSASASATSPVEISPQLSTFIADLPKLIAYLSQSYAVFANEKANHARSVPTSGQKKKAYQPSPAISDYRKDVQALIDANVSNYTRTKFISMLLFRAAEYGVKHLDLGPLFQKNALTRVMHYYLFDVLGRLIVNPMTEHKCFGNILPVWESCPDLTKLIASGGRDNVVLAFHYVMAELQYLNQHRTDILRAQAEHATVFQEDFTEMNNAQTILVIYSHHYIVLFPSHPFYYFVTLYVIQAMDDWGESTYPGLRRRSVGQAKKAEDMAGIKDFMTVSGNSKYDRTQLSEEAKQKILKSDPLGRNDPPEYPSEVDRLVRRMLPGGSQEPLIIELAHFLVTWITDVGAVPMDATVAAVIDNFRVLEYQAANIDSVHIRGEKHLKKAKKNEDAAVAALAAKRAGTAGPEEPPKTIDEMEHLLNAQLAKNTLKPLVDQLKASSPGTLSSVRVSGGKLAYIRNIKLAIQLLHPTGSVAIQLERLKHFCLQRGIQLKDPEEPFYQGMLASQPKEKECIQEVYENCPSLDTIRRYHMTIDYNGPSLYPQTKMQAKQAAESGAKRII